MLYSLASNSNKQDRISSVLEELTVQQARQRRSGAKMVSAQVKVYGQSSPGRILMGELMSELLLEGRIRVHRDRVGTGPSK